ncbi:MAG: helix-turn-helix domain-containing protein [Caldilinea sp. CFX5]|nr:helix-turn-helix domain-containing protein [Caldilinea sp. CFX5]
MFNLTSSVPKSWQTVSRQADRATNEATPHHNTLHHQAHIAPPRDLGGVLRERREAMGASLAEVEAATRIRQKYLAALESDEWQLLPGEVVGRGFLRNYATYLGLDPTEVVNRRRAIADGQLAAALAGTSAGSALPPERDIDYRPKDVHLKDEPEGIQQRELRVGPYLTIILLLGALLLIWWLAGNFGREISASVGSMLAAAQTRGAELRNNSVATSAVTPSPNMAADNPNTNAVPISANNVVTNNVPSAPAANNVASNPPATQAVVLPNPPGQDQQSQPPEASASDPPSGFTLIPTNTPLPTPTAAIPITPTNPPEPTPLPTNTPEPPTPTPVPPPTNTPEPTPTTAPPAVVAAVCADSRLAFSNPGIGQVLSGVVSVTGRATHENPDYYKLEYAVGANAEGGYVYFDGNKGQVDGGILGTLNTTALPNGEYTLQLTMVDLTGNFPPPCRVSIVIQN